MFPFIICIEGHDKTGKSTQVKLISDELRSLGYNVLNEEVPPKGIIRDVIYKMLNNGASRRYPTIFQILQFLSRYIWQKLYLLKVRDVDIIVLSRWSLSSLIYGTVEGVNQRLLNALNDLMIKPDVTFIIHGKSFGRASQRDDAYEKDVVLQHRVKFMYNKLGPKHGHMISNRRSQIDVTEAILKIAVPLVKKSVIKRNLSSASFL